MVCPGVIATATHGCLGFASVLPVENAIVGIDLADKKQMVVVCDHDSAGAGTQDFPLPGLGSWRCFGLGAGARGREGVHWRDRGV
jgi:hypothetical protein